MAFVWDLRKSQKHNTTENLVNTRVLGVFRGGYNKALGGDRSIQLSYTHILGVLLSFERFGYYLGVIGVLSVKVSGLKCRVLRGFSDFYFVQVGT